MTPSKLQLKELASITTDRINQDLEMIKLGLSDTKEAEINQSLTMWQEVKSKDYNYDDLTQQAKQEVDETLFEEED